MTNSRVQPCRGGRREIRVADGRVRPGRVHLISLDEDQLQPCRGVAWLFHFPSPRTAVFIDWQPPAQPLHGKRHLTWELLEGLLQ